MRKVLFGIILLAAIFGLYRWRKVNAPNSSSAGGELVITQRTEPASFNRIVVPQFGTELVSRLINGYLIRVNRQTGEIQPWLASSWKVADDGMTHTMTLRRRSRTACRSHPPTWCSRSARAATEARERHRDRHAHRRKNPYCARSMPAVAATFPPSIRASPFSTRCRSCRATSSRRARRGHCRGGTASPASDFAGLSPFTLVAWPDSMWRVVKNPRYWEKDAAGHQLPYLDSLQSISFPENAEMLRLQSGTRIW